MSDTAPSNDVRHVGRPTKFNEESVKRLCAAIGDGMPIKGACVVAGIGVTTLNEWRERYPDLQERLSAGDKGRWGTGLASLGCVAKVDLSCGLPWDPSKN